MKKIKKINKVIKALFIICEAYSKNVSAHNRYGYMATPYYEAKQKYIDIAISYIRKNKLPIKYGIADNVYYFSFAGIQVSFHSFSRQVREKKIKTYHGKWCGRKNGDICPFYNFALCFLMSEDENKYEKFAQKYLYFPS